MERKKCGALSSNANEDDDGNKEDSKEDEEDLVALRSILDALLGSDSGAGLSGADGLMGTGAGAGESSSRK
jgi:hypothetical protein